MHEAMRLPRLLLLALACPLALRALPGPQTASQPTPSPLPYQWSSVAIGGGGFVTGLVFHPLERGLLYARTDVGGAYRWEESTKSWVALTDFLGMDDVNLTGIESLAVDPSDPQRVYLACGTYTAPNIGNGAVFASSDRGRTFTRADMPFKMGGNEASRGNGERLAVDPNDGRRLFLGSRAAGLWQSGDRGATWTHVASFPAIATSEDARDTGPWKQALGIVFVLFDPASGKAGTPSQTLYAGVSTHKQWLYRSTDAGQSWTPVPGQPLGLRPTRPSRASDGTLYFSMADQPGPNTMADGAVWKYEPSTERWTNITPVDPRKETPSYGYGAVCVDPANPSRLLVSTFCRYEPLRDVIFRSLDGGRTWRNLFTSSRFLHPDNPWAAEHMPHWMADVRIDPFDPGHALFVTGYGVYRTRGLLANDEAPSSALDWNFDNRGLEETVPLGLISPPKGAHLLSALGDIDGFRHEDFTRPGKAYSPAHSLTNTESIAFAAQMPEKIVRCGTVRHRKGEVRALHSADSGATWQRFHSEPPDCAGAGTIDLSADASVVVWTSRKTPPAGSTGFSAWRLPPNTPYLSVDHGRTWQPCEGLPAGVRVIADKNEALRWYAFNPASGTLFVSSDGARTFTQRAQELPSLQSQPGGFGGGEKSGGILHSVAGRPGELWLETRTAGLHHSTDGGTTWTAIPGVSAAYSLGFGKAPDGAAHPTLYLAGQVRTAKGLFRSTDNGLHWVEISDARHRFGWVNHVTGDPRVFGRVYFGSGGRGVIVGDPKK